MLHLILSVKISLDDLISFNEPIELSLKLVILFSEKSLMTVQSLQLPS